MKPVLLIQGIGKSRGRPVGLVFLTKWTLLENAECLQKHHSTETAVLLTLCGSVSMIY